MVSRRLVVDTNLLVLLVVGSSDPSLIHRHKRTRVNYTEADFILLVNVIARHDTVLTTPNIVSEASNLLRQSDVATGGRLMSTLKAFLESGHELYVPSIDAACNHMLPRFGITDCAILELIDDSTTLITVDAGLHLEALRINPSAMNFNHLRDELM